MIRPQDLKGEQLFYRCINGAYVVSRTHWGQLNLYLPFPGLIGAPPEKIQHDNGVAFVGTALVRLYADGRMMLARGFVWDGASGPTLDDETTRRNSAYHDGGASLSRAGLISPTMQDYFDKILKNVGVADGMPYARAELWHFGVDRFGGFAWQPGYEPYPEESAPIIGDPLKPESEFSFDIHNGLKPAG